MNSTLDPNSLNKFARNFPFWSFLLLIIIQYRPSNKLWKPDSGPECSVPAKGCDGIKYTLLGINGERSLITETFVEPVSVKIAPFFKNGEINLPTLAIAPTGIAKITKSESLTDSSTELQISSAIFKDLTVFRYWELLSYTLIKNLFFK